MRSKSQSHDGELVWTCTLLQLPTYSVRVQDFEFGVGEGLVARTSKIARRRKLPRSDDIRRLVFTTKDRSHTANFVCTLPPLR